MPYILPVPKAEATAEKGVGYSGKNGKFTHFTALLKIIPETEIWDPSSDPRAVLRDPGTFLKSHKIQESKLNPEEH